jgi:formylglycine-generating enzyme required for sulfatase activity
VRRKLLILGLLLLLVVAGVIAWPLAGLPPPRYLLRYGLSPGCEPTGETLVLEGVEFVEIGPGVFRMGSDKLAKGGDWLGRICATLGLPWGRQPEPSNEMPVHWVEFPRGFWIARTEVTNAQYERFDREYERFEFSEGDDDPVVDVSWTDAERYCAWLAERSDRKVRLPSESLWECACRAGSRTEYCFGDDASNLGKHAWIDENSDDRTHPVGTKRPNAWGLFDMHGSVWEWCEDTWHDSYRGAPDDGSAWVDEGSSFRVLHGGGWIIPAGRYRSSYRLYSEPSTGFGDIGFRPAFVTSDR